MADQQKYEVDTARLLKMSSEDLQLYKDASAAKGQTLSAWMRDECRRSANRILKKKRAKA